MFIPYNFNAKMLFKSFIIIQKQLKIILNEQESTGNLFSMFQVPNTLLCSLMY